MWCETCGPAMPLEDANTCPAAHVRELAEMIRRAPAITPVRRWPKHLGMKCPVSFPRVHQREGELSFSCAHVFGLWTHHSRWKSAALCHRYIKSVVMMERISLLLHREARKHPLRCPFQHKKHKENIQLCSLRLFLARESLKKETQAHLYTTCSNVCIFYFPSAAENVQHAKYLFTSNNIYLLKTLPYRM